MQVGKEAAVANTAIYTLFVDTSLHDRFGAETRNGDRTSVNRRRDTAVLARWLEQFAGAAGGALFTVQVGNADVGARAHSDRAVVVLPARRRAGGRGSRRPHARSRGEGDAAERSRFAAAAG